MKINKKGFTLVELLVVIAIIGILSTVAVVNLNSARSKAQDASVKGSMATLSPQAEIIWDNDGGTYANVCSDASIVALLAGLEVAASTDCEDTAAGWAASGALTGTSRFWCVDSAGNTVETAAVQAADDITCI